MKKVKLLNNKEGIQLEKIDSKEIAYLVGFICADSSIASNSSVEFGVKLGDREIIDFLSNLLFTKTNIDMSFNKQSRRLPRARFTKNIIDILQFVKSRLKEGRVLPIIPKQFEKYMVLGFFDGDGCITWGRRKDRGRLWQKVSFTSALKMLIHIQKILNKINISTIIRPKTGENTFVLEFSSKEEVLKFGNWLYKDTDLIILNRKFNNFQALRLELDKFGETATK